jgi:hypothetical protein
MMSVGCMDADCQSCAGAERELERVKGLLQNETGKNEIAQRDIIALKMELDAVIRQNEERKRALDCIGIVASLARPK